LRPHALQAFDAADGLALPTLIESIDTIAATEKSARLTSGNQAHAAPPPLTFGLPGKQMVKPPVSGPDLTRVLKRLR
jgi:hypothetical protein